MAADNVYVNSTAATVVEHDEVVYPDVKPQPEPAPEPECCCKTINISLHFH